MLNYMKSLFHASNLSICFSRILRLFPLPLIPFQPFSTVPKLWVDPLKPQISQLLHLSSLLLFTLNMKFISLPSWSSEIELISLYDISSISSGCSEPSSISPFPSSSPLLSCCCRVSLLRLSLGLLWWFPVYFLDWSFLSRISPLSPWVSSCLSPSQR